MTGFSVRKSGGLRKTNNDMNLCVITAQTTNQPPPAFAKQNKAALVKVFYDATHSHSVVLLLQELILYCPLLDNKQHSLSP